MDRAPELLIIGVNLQSLGSIHFLEGGGGWAGGIPTSMHVKSPSPPFIFLLKSVTLSWEAVKFIETHLSVVSNLC